MFPKTVTMYLATAPLYNFLRNFLFRNKPSLQVEVWDAGASESKLFCRDPSHIPITSRLSVQEESEFPDLEL